MNPRMIETMIESTLSVQNPPSPMGCVRDVRWCAMYSEGFSYWAMRVSESLLVLFCVRHGDGRGEYQYCDHERREERDVHHFLVYGERDPESGEDQEDLDGLRPHHRLQSLPGRACFPPRD